MSNLLDSASIVLTPTAYDNGRMLSVKPIPVYGPELVTNGDFATDSDWIKASGSTISGGSLNIVAAPYNANTRQSLSLTNGTTYEIVINAIAVGSATDNTFQLGFADSAGNPSNTTQHEFAVGTSVKKLIVTASATDSAIIFRSRDAGTSNLSITNVSVKEVLVADGDFDFSRNSAATRVNAQGLVENVQILSGDLVSNGDFSQEGVQEVSNGSFSQEGAEQVVNGDFATDSDWTKQSNWTIANGSANSNGSGLIYQTSVSYVDGKTYKVTFDANITSGGGTVRLGNTTSTIAFTNGANEFYLQTDASNTTRYIFFQGNSLVGSIDNVSVKEVGQDWVLQTGWSIEEDKATCNGTPFAQIYQTNVLTQNKTYKVTYTITSYVSGSVRAKLGNSTNGADNNANGTYTEYIYFNEANLTFHLRSGSFNGSITNISVKEVGQDWSVIDSDANNYVEFGDGTARLKFLNTSPITQLRATGTYVSGKKYKLTVDVLSITSGSIKVANAGINETFDTVGISTRIINPTGTSNLEFYRASANVDITLNSVSLIEITDDTNLPRINYEGFSYQDSLGSELVTNGDFATNSDWILSGQNLSISNGKGISTGSNFGAQFKQTILTTNKVYSLTFDIVDYTSGSIGLTANYYGEAAQYGSIGTHTTTFTSLSQTEFRLYSQNFIGSIDNVSVKEYLGQEVVPDSGCGSWLLEPQSTNFAVPSDNKNNINSGDIQGTYVPNVLITAPDNSNTAYKFTPTQLGQSVEGASASTNNRLYFEYGGVNTTYTNSIYVKSVSGNTFNFAIKVVNQSSDTLISSKTILVTDVWKRVDVTGLVNGSSSGIRYVIKSEQAVNLWGFQIEKQSFSTSYIPTSGAISTRLQDIANNSGNATLINSTEGVLYAEIAALAKINPSGNITLTDGTGDNRIYIYYLIDNSISVIYNVNSTGASINNFSLSNITDQTKIAVRWGNSNVSVWINGTSVLSNTTSNFLPNTLNVLSFAKPAGGVPFEGKVKALVVYKEALTDEQLTCLTTI